MIRLTITAEAHAAIARTMAEGVKLQPIDEDGRVLIWLPQGVARALARLRRPGEDYSALIIRIADGQV